MSSLPFLIQVEYDIPQSAPVQYGGLSSGLLPTFFKAMLLQSSCHHATQTPVELSSLRGCLSVLVGHWSLRTGAPELALRKLSKCFNILVDSNGIVTDSRLCYSLGPSSFRDSVNIDVLEGAEQGSGCNGRMEAAVAFYSSDPLDSNALQ